jgi:hypothetical protein
VAGSCERDNEPSGSIKCWRVLAWFSKYLFLKKDLALWIDFVSGVTHNSSFSIVSGTN